VIQIPASARSKISFEGQRPAVAPENATLIVAGKTAPQTIKDAIDQLRFAALQPPKPTSKLSHRMRAEAIADWRIGFIEGIRYALKILEAIQ